MRHFVTALVLACVLSGTVLAGEIPTTGATSPPPSGAGEKAGEIHTVGGEIPTTGATAPPESTTVLTIILAVLGIVP